jgi:hypothetical protein
MPEASIDVLNGWRMPRQAIEIVHEFIAGGKEVARLLKITKF